jgi:hypothetical protein
MRGSFRSPPRFRSTVTRNCLTVETMGSGGLFFDYDGDGWIDIFVVDSGSIADVAVDRQARHRLYHNRGNGTFEDVTDRSGIQHRAYGIGERRSDRLGVATRPDGGAHQRIREPDHHHQGGQRNRCPQALVTLRPMTSLRHGALPFEASATEADVPILRRGVFGGVGDHIDLGVVIVLEDQVSPVVAELDTAAIERD